MATTRPESLDDMLNGHTATLIGCGHTHIQMLRQHKGMLIVNPGSVGLPFEEYVAGGPPTVLDHAEYAIIELDGTNIDISLRRIPYDVDAFRKSVLGSERQIQALFPWSS